MEPVAGNLLREEGGNEYEAGKKRVAGIARIGIGAWHSATSNISVVTGHDESTPAVAIGPLRWTTRCGLRETLRWARGHRPRQRRWSCETST